ncbi:MAG: hypothetical protein DMG57_08365 [Acidobacteria bacterium]|nr:MAG: hypothetical protein DMG57_08365 [Acidobacteriota bacterium]
MRDRSRSCLFLIWIPPRAGQHVSLSKRASSFMAGYLNRYAKALTVPRMLHTLTVWFRTNMGFRCRRPRQACLYELSSGNPAWRHFEKEEVWGRPSRTLVLRTAAVIGNYDYLMDWRFEQDGSIRIALGATGIIETKGVTARRTVSSSHASTWTWMGRTTRS